MSPPVKELKTVQYSISRGTTLVKGRENWEKEGVEGELFCPFYVKKDTKQWEGAV